MRRAKIPNLNVLLIGHHSSTYFRDYNDQYIINQDLSRLVKLDVKHLNNLDMKKRNRIKQPSVIKKLNQRFGTPNSPLII